MLNSVNTIKHTWSNTVLTLPIALAKIHPTVGPRPVEVAFSEPELDIHKRVLTALVAVCVSWSSASLTDRVTLPGVHRAVHVHPAGIAVAVPVVVEAGVGHAEQALVRAWAETPIAGVCAQANVETTVGAGPKVIALADVEGVELAVRGTGDAV